jgi:phosphoribosyl 1,2-cyclic phosphodiesterase
MVAGIDCFMSRETSCVLGIERNHRCQMVDKSVQFDIADFTVLPFDIQHDCVGGLGFFIQYRPTGERLLYLTDSYYCKYRFNALSYILVECNYTKETLDSNVEAGLINEALKRRLMESHFSLEHVKDFLKANDLAHCRKIVLLHLSEANSSASRMVDEIESLTGISTVVATANKEIELEMFPY